MQKVLSSKERLQKIVNDIQIDMETRPRLDDRPGQCSADHQQYLRGL